MPTREAIQMYYIYEHLSDIRLSTEKIRAGQLYFATEIMLKSTFLCESRSATCIRYGFHARAKAIRHSMRTALQCKCFVQTCTMQE